MSSNSQEINQQLKACQARLSHQEIRLLEELEFFSLVQAFREEERLLGTNFFILSTHNKALLLKESIKEVLGLQVGRKPTCTCRRLLRYAGFSLTRAGQCKKRSADRDVYYYSINLRKYRVSTKDLRPRLSFETSFQCEICLRTRKELSGLVYPLKLEIHHVIEFKDGGDESSENLRVYCEECHATVHRIRKSFLRYSANA